MVYTSLFNLCDPQKHDWILYPIFDWKKKNSGEKKIHIILLLQAFYIIRKYKSLKLF